MTEHATITPAECDCIEHTWVSFDPGPEEYGSWVRCSCCGLEHMLQPGERLFVDEVLFSSEWLSEDAA